MNRQRDLVAGLMQKTDALAGDISRYFRGNLGLIGWLAVLAMAAYGFELFNLNLTIDEELHAQQFGAVTGWLAQGRWGMHVLNAYLFPYTEIPFVPLFVALIFHIAAVLLLLQSWRVESRLDQLAIGAVSLTFPVIVYLYTFDTFNFGIGIGLFCVALGVLIYARTSGWNVLWASVPVALSISIYQGFLGTLAAAFLLYIIRESLHSGQLRWKSFLEIAGIVVVGALGYYAVQRLMLLAVGTRDEGYVSSFFAIGALRTNLGSVLSRAGKTMLSVYAGDATVYGIPLTSQKIFMLALLLGWAAALLRSKLSPGAKTFLGLFWLGLIALPFAGGLLMNGLVAMRFLVAMPIVAAGLVMLGLGGNSRALRLVIGLLVGVAVFQYVVATNHLFAASHVALEEDRLFANTLLERIDALKAGPGGDQVRYLETVGYYARPASALVPKIETVGASFFEWDGGNTGRIVAFLDTVGEPGLQPLPLDRRPQFVALANSMPVWPRAGSMVAVGDTILLKFGPYSFGQKQQICLTKPNRAALKAQGFCDGG